MHQRSFHNCFYWSSNITLCMTSKMTSTTLLQEWFGHHLQCHLSWRSKELMPGLWLDLQKSLWRSTAMNPKLLTMEWSGLWFIWTNAIIWVCTEPVSMPQVSKGLCNLFCCNTSPWKQLWEQTAFCGSWNPSFIRCLSWHRLVIALQWIGIIEMKRQGEHWPEWQGLVVASRIPGVLAVDVCKGFAVTTMCLSCEKMQCSKTCSNKAWVKHVVGKARCPKHEEYKNRCFEKSKILCKQNKWEGEEGKPKYTQTKTKDKKNNLKKQNKEYLKKT